MNDNEVAIRVTGSNSSTPAIDSAKRSMKGLKDEAGETSVKVRVLGESVSSTSRKTDDLGDKARKTTRELSALDRKILELRASTLALGREFEKTGDTSLLKKFRTDSRELSGLERMRKQISGLTDDVKGLGSTASTFASFFQGGILKALMNPTGAAVAAPFAAGAVINAGALAGGALTAGVGAGVAGAGVAGAAMQSKAVQDEWTKVTDRIENQFRRATTSFEQPTIAAVRRLDAAVEAIPMEKIFGQASKFVEPLSVGAAKAVGSIGRGVEALVDKGEPAIRATGDAVAEIGDGVEKAMETIAGGSEGGAKAIRDLGSAVSETVQDIGYFVRGTEEAYGALDSFRQKAAEVHPFIGLIYDIKGTDKVSVLSDTLERVKVASNGVTGSFQGMAVEVYNTADAARELDGRFKDLFEVTLNQGEANLKVKQGFADLKAELQDGKRTLDDNTQAGRDNIDALYQQLELLNRKREADIAAGNGTVESARAANEAYTQQVQGIRNMLISLGYAKAEVDAFIAAFLAMNGKTVDINVNTHYNDFYARQGGPNRDAFDAGSRLDRRGIGNRAHGGITGAASGKILSGLANVAERGREIALLAPGVAALPPGSQVIPNGMTENMLAGGSGGGQAPIVINVYGSVISERELLTTISNNVKDLGGRPELLGLKAA